LKLARNFQNMELLDSFFIELIMNG
jgi:hypothetical protein